MSSLPKGYVLIINNTIFPNEVDPEKMYRKGSEKDAQLITTVFTNLGYKVIQKDNLNAAVSS